MSGRRGGRGLSPVTGVGFSALYYMKYVTFSCNSLLRRIDVMHRCDVRTEPEEGPVSSDAHASQGLGGSFTTVSVQQHAMKAAMDLMGEHWHCFRHGIVLTRYRRTSVYVDMTSATVGT